MYKIYPSSLIKLYASVPHPHTTVSGEHIALMLPTDTDFKSYKEKGKFGFDFAFYSLGYGYHNLLDTVDRMKKGSIQHHGENHLALIIKIVETNILDEKIDETKFIYFDLMGMYLIYYTKWWSTLIQLITISMGISLPFINNYLLKYEKLILEKNKLSLEFINEQIENSTRYSLLYFVSYFMSLIFGVLYTFFVSLLFFYINPMGWFYSYKITLIIFGIPTFLGLISFQWLINAFIGRWCCQRLKQHRPKIKYNGNLTKFYSLQKETYIGLALFWSLLSFIIICTNIDSLYPIVIYSVVSIIGIYFCFFIDFIFRLLIAKLANDDIINSPDIYLNRYFSFKYMYIITEHKIFWFLVPFLFIIPNIICYDVFTRVLKAIIPLLEAIPGYSDIIIGLYISICICIILISYLPILHQSSNFGKLFLTFFSIFLIIFLIHIFRFPYSSETPLTIHMRNLHRNNLEFNLQNEKAYIYENSTEYLLVSTQTNLAPLLKNYQDIHKKPFNYDCRYISFYICKIEKTTLHLISSIDYKILQRSEKSLLISLKPLVPTRFTSIFSKTKLSFDLDKNKNEIVENTNGYFKYGYNQEEWIIQIPKIPTEQVTIVFTMNYCNISELQFLDNFLKTYSFIQIQGDPECSLMKIENHILIK